jgi:hypothetical protein
MPGLGRVEYSAERQSATFFFELACAAEIQPTTVAAMKIFTKAFTIPGALLFSLALGIVAGTPEQEKAFTDKYKTAMEGQGYRYHAVFPLHARV